MCWEGEPLNVTNLKTEEQQAIMRHLGRILEPLSKTGATQYPGALSAPPNAGMIAAMNTMMGMGGYGGYEFDPSSWMSQYGLPLAAATWPNDGVPGEKIDVDDKKKRKEDEDEVRKFNYTPLNY